MPCTPLSSVTKNIITSTSYCFRNAALAKSSFLSSPPFLAITLVLSGIFAAQFISFIGISSLHIQESTAHGDSPDFNRHLRFENLIVSEVTIRLYLRLLVFCVFAVAMTVINK
jgi:hypothetical protein